VYDVVEANVKALTTTFSGGVNIATGVETSITRVYELLAKAANVSAPAKLAPGKPGEQRISVLSPAKAKAELGWMPKYGVAEGLAQTVEWARAARS
jgi:UDP-glucose 4-epimerase